MRCTHCDTHLEGDPFTYRHHAYCCACMSELCSWLLDGGVDHHPDQFPELDPTP